METIIYFDRPIFKLLLSLREKTLANVAIDAGISVQYLRQIASGYVPPKPIQEKIAHSLIVETYQLWRVIPKKISRRISLEN